MFMGMVGLGGSSQASKSMMSTGLMVVAIILIIIGVITYSYSANHKTIGVVIGVIGLLLGLGEGYMMMRPPDQTLKKALAARLAGVSVAK